MQHTAEVHASLVAEGPTALFKHPRNVAWLYELECLVRLQRSCLFYANGAGVRFDARRLTGGRQWAHLKSPLDLRPGHAVRVQSAQSAQSAQSGGTTPYLVVAVRRTTFHVVLTVLLHIASGTLLLVFTGLQSRALGAGANVTCNAVLTPLDAELRSLLGRAPHVPAYQTAEVHRGLLAMSRHFSHSRAFSTACGAAAGKHVKRVVVAGFSMGGAMAHLLSAVVREFLGHTAPHKPLMVIAEGAPRTGDTLWADSFAVRSPTFVHVALAAGIRESAHAVQVDEVVTLPLHATGFTTCAPLVVVVDGAFAFESPLMRTRDLWNLKHNWMLCVSSINFLRGFSTAHRLALLHARGPPPPPPQPTAGHAGPAGAAAAPAPAPA